MKNFRSLGKSIALAIPASLICVACGGAGDNSATTTTPTATTSSTTTVSTAISAACISQLQNQDTDSDGVSDYDEIYGKSVSGFTGMIYSDPTLADTDGDGRKDGDELSLAATLSGSNEALTVTAPIFHPAYPDFAVRVFARGGAEGVQNSSASTGWNSFAKLTFAASDAFSIRDIRSSQWETITGTQTSSTAADPLTGAEGFANWLLNGDCSNNNCLVNDNRALLIGKFATTASVSDLGHTPFDLGDSMTASSNFTYTGTASAGYLFLRANDRDKLVSSDKTATGLTDNSGSIVVVVTRNPAAPIYSQVAATDAQLSSWAAKLCTQ